MINIYELESLLEKLNIPYAYSHFNTSATKLPPKPPYVVYLEEDSQNFNADNQVYKKYLDYRVEVYTDKKDLKLEKQIEDLFDENKVVYDTDELFIVSQKLFERIYYITLTK